MPSFLTSFVIKGVHHHSNHQNVILNHETLLFWSTLVAGIDAITVRCP